MSVKKLLFVCVFSIFGNLYATFQTPEILTCNSDNLLIDAHNRNNIPLEAYYKKFPEKKPKIKFRSSNCWRGYKAEYVIDKDKKLYLVGAKIGEVSMLASEMMGYPCQYPVFCDWFSTDKLIFIETQKAYRQYSISVDKGIACIHTEVIQSHWASNDDLNRRAGVCYNPQNDAYQNWFDLRELSNNGAEYLTKDEYFHFRNPTSIAKTRGILETTNNYTRLKLPRTTNNKTTYFFLKKKNNSLDLKNYNGKFVECEIEDIFNKQKIKSIRELSKTESIHKKYLSRHKRENYQEQRNLGFLYAHRNNLIDFSKIDFSKLEFELAAEQTFGDVLVISYNRKDKNIDCAAIAEYKNSSVYIQAIVSKKSNDNSFRTKVFINKNPNTSVYIGDKKVWQNR